jgi:hypothetical protein
VCEEKACTDITIVKVMEEKGHRDVLRRDSLELPCSLPC